MTDFDMNVTMGEGVRRLPVYLLLDCSGSMGGAPIESVKRGVELFISEVAGDTYARQTVHVGVITFASEAALVTKGLVPFDAFTMPTLSASGTTALGGALRLLRQSLDSDLRKSVPGGEKGDWKPLVFVLTDGAPTDAWQEPRQDLLSRQSGKVINMITVGCGTGINEEQIKAIAIGPTFRMDATESSFKTFFQWVSQSVKAVSKAVSQPDAGQAPSAMPQPDPAVIQYVP